MGGKEARKGREGCGRSRRAGKGHALLAGVLTVEVLVHLTSVMSL